MLSTPICLLKWSGTLVAPGWWLRVGMNPQILSENFVAGLFFKTCRTFKGDNLYPYFPQLRLSTLEMITSFPFIKILFRLEIFSSWDLVVCCESAVFLCASLCTSFDFFLIFSSDERLSSLHLLGSVFFGTKYFCLFCF